MEGMKMFKVIHHNPDKTVGITSNPTNLQHLGSFKPALLKEWLKMIDEVFGDDIEDVEILVRKSDSCECFALFASHDGNSPFVAVCGRYKMDGSKWEDVK